MFLEISSLKFSDKFPRDFSGKRGPQLFFPENLQKKFRGYFRTHNPNVAYSEYKGLKAFWQAQTEFKTSRLGQFIAKDSNRLIHQSATTSVTKPTATLAPPFYRVQTGCCFGEFVELVKLLGLLQLKSVARNDYQSIKHDV